ncbi:MAG: hypothetical protein INR69_02180 [Mucilaginibacter polytrichastri]|nr:hypothetical protein [Mucilaginibacter polytrichastri]
MQAMIAELLVRGFVYISRLNLNMNTKRHTPVPEFAYRLAGFVLLAVLIYGLIHLR